MNYPIRSVVMSCSSRVRPLLHGIPAIGSDMIDLVPPRDRGTATARTTPERSCELEARAG